MSKRVLSEGLFDRIVGFLMKGKINKGIEALKKDPEVKKSMDKFEKSKEDLRKSLEDYEVKYGETPHVKKIKAAQRKFGL